MVTSALVPGLIRFFRRGAHLMSSDLWPGIFLSRRFFGKAVLVFFCLACVPVTISFGFEFPGIEFAPRQYVCRRADGPVTIDGKLDEQAWEAAAWTEDFIDIDGPHSPAPAHRTSVRMLWDDKYF